MSLAIAYALSLLLIIAASELFTNAVEWAGYRLGIAQGATGSLIAAIGTALPEAVVPVVALIGHAPSADSVAIGAVLGAPFLLLTIGVAVTGLAVLLRSERRRLELDRRQARRDLGVFVGAFAVAIAASALPAPGRVAVGLGLLVSYALYVRATLRGGAPAEEMPEPLHMVRWRSQAEPGNFFVLAQLLGAAALLVVGSTLFVSALDSTARSLHANPLILALIVVPLATELPETMNSVLWIRSDDDGLAFGNVAGSATFQACILGFIGVTFTSWQLGAGGLVTTGLTLATAVGLLALLRGGRCRGGWLLLAAMPWLAYVLGQVALART